MGIIIHIFKTVKIIKVNFFDFYICFSLGKWYEFNDVHVSEFNIQNLKSECFGGEYENLNK